MVDAEGNESQFSYTSDGLLSMQQDLDRGTVTNRYTSYGDVSRTTVDGSTAEILYDRVGRALRREDADGITTWTFDESQGSAIGKLTTSTSPTGVVTRYWYEDAPRGLLTSTLTELGEESFSTTVHYDEHGRQELLEYPSAPGFDLSVKYSYDEYSGALTKISPKNEDEVFWELSEIDGRGRLQQEQFGNGTRTDYRYDSNTEQRRRVEVSNETRELARLEYPSYQPSGRIQTRSVEVGPLTRTHRFDYDDAQRLEAVFIRDGDDDLIASDSFDYSASGRILSRGSLGAFDYDIYRPHAVTGVAEAHLPVQRPR